MDLAFVLGSLVIAVIGLSNCVFTREELYSRTFPRIDDGNTIINFDIAIGLIASRQREEIFSWTTRAFLESDWKMDEVKLTRLAGLIWENLFIYIEIVQSEFLQTVVKCSFDDFGTMLAGDGVSKAGARAKSGGACLFHNFEVYQQIDC